MSNLFGRKCIIVFSILIVILLISFFSFIPSVSTARQAGNFRDYIGRYNFDRVNGFIILENPQVVDALRRANVPDDVRDEIKRYEVGGPIEDRQGLLVSQGCLPHFCDEFHYKLYINLETNSVALCHFARQTIWYSSQSAPSAPDSDPCPSEVSGVPSSIRAALGQGNAPAAAVPLSGASTTQGANYAQSLVGYWAPDGEVCDSDAGIDYSADGTWSAYDESGTWTIRENLLVMRTHSRGYPGEEMVPLRPPEININTIVSLSNASMTQRWPNGMVVDFHRCIF